MRRWNFFSPFSNIWKEEQELLSITSRCFMIFIPFIHLSLSPFLYSTKHTTEYEMLRVKECQIELSGHHQHFKREEGSGKHIPEERILSLSFFPLVLFQQTSLFESISMQQFSFTKNQCTFLLFSYFKMNFSPFDLSFHNRKRTENAVFTCMCTDTREMKWNMKLDSQGECLAKDQ